MAISSYQIENILKSYSKQDRVKIKPPVVKENSTPDNYVDTVTLSSGMDKSAVYNKISYSLLDVIIKDSRKG
jgi:hypothetical protein